MSLKRLACLVLAVVLGTAFSVQSYLEAAQVAPLATRTEAQPVSYPHVSVPMRAEPARQPLRLDSPSRSYSSLARQEADRPCSSDAPRPTAPAAAPAAPSAFDLGLRP